MNISQFRAGSAVPACVLLLILSGLFGCLPKLDPGPPPERLLLKPAMPEPLFMTPLKKQLVVSTPTAASDIDNDRIALVYNGREVRYLSGARWSGSLVPLAQRLVIEALESSKAFAGVGDELAGIAAEVRLITDIKQFSLDYAGENTPAVAHFAATFKLMDLARGRMIGTREIDIQVPAAGSGNAALAAALENAMGKGLGEMVEWVAQSMRRSQ